MIPDVTVMEIYEQTRADEFGKAAAFIHVTYKVGRHGPFFVRIPKDSYTQGEFERLIQPIVFNVREMSAQRGA